MKPKVLILQHEITRYNSPIYSMIGREVDLTVGYFKKDASDENVTYAKHRFETSEIWKFTFLKGMFKFCKSFDAVIFDCNPVCLSMFFIPFVCRKYKAIPWTIGVRASYKRRYVLPFPKKGLYYRLMNAVFRKSDAVVFYMGEPIPYWVTKRLPKEKFFVAHNTVPVIEEGIDWEKPRHSITFVGSLYAEKKADELLHAYIDAFQYGKADQMPILEFVGDGALRNSLEQLAKEKSLEEKVIFHGAIFDEATLRDIFSRSMICISPDQAGLSVLKSMGYGVPFATRHDAITGGERLNIKDGYNGFLYHRYEDLVSIIKDTISSPDKFLQLGRNAREYYEQNATPQKMADGFLNAISYALKTEKS